MFKLTISLIALAAFNCACASPIPPVGTNVVTDKAAELAGSISGVAPRQLDGLDEDEITALLGGLTNINGRQLNSVPVVGSLPGGLPGVGSVLGIATGGSGVGSGLLKRRDSLPIVGSLVGGLPVVGSLLGGATGGATGGLASGLLKRQDAGDLLGDVIDIGSVLGGEAKRQLGDVDADPLELLPGLGGL